MRLPLLSALLLLAGAAAAQHRLRPYAGLHASGDAAMIYLGPSAQVGADYYLFHHLSLSTYVHYFHRHFDRKFDQYEFEEGKFNCLTGALLAELRLGRQPKRRGAFIGAGIAVQRLQNDYHSSRINSYWLRPHDVLPAARLGYACPLGQHQLTVELNATGPYNEHRTTYHYTESITQLSLGTRLVW